MQTSQENIEPEYIVTRLNKKNLGDVARLHKTVYGAAADTDHFTKKYDTAYTGVEDVGFIAYNTDGIPVAYYGVIPCFMQYGDTIILAAQSADTMTHPQHRYKGMFVELSNKTFELCRDLGILLVFGFPNQNSYHGAVNKLGWTMTGAMDCFTIPVRSLPLESLLKRINLGKLYQRYSRSVIKKRSLPLGGIANSVLADGFAGLFRGNEYFDHKSYSPTKVIASGGSRIWISNKYGMMIGDMDGVNDGNFGSVMKELKKIAKKLGIRQIQFHCSPGTGLHRLFSAKYKATPSYPMLFQDFGSGIPPEKIRFTFADIDIF